MSYHDVSLSQRYGLRATNGLECPDGGTHKVDDGDLRRVSHDGGGQVLCLACGGVVRLVSTS